MVLLIDRLSIVYIRAAIREIRFHFRIAQLQKSAVPEELSRRLFGKLRDGFVIQPAEVTVDLDEVLYRVALILDLMRVR